MIGEYTFLNRNQYVETSKPIEEKKQNYYYVRWDEGITVREINQSLHLWW